MGNSSTEGRYENEPPATLQAGMVVNVFQDPISCLDFEGLAELIQPVVSRTHRWWVKFPGEDTLYQRTINPKAALSQV